jgi:hypothetical protein
MTIHPQLDLPPIHEVVCGCRFASIEKLTALHLGVYWASCRDRYPKHEIHPPLDTPIGAFKMVTPRAWFVSEDDSLIVQIQHDRLYVNWRARGGKYPRFTSGDHPLLQRTLDEIRAFSAFCSDEFKQDVQQTLQELAKIDHLTENTHWNGYKDLKALVPSISAVKAPEDEEPGSLELKSSFERAPRTITLGMRLAAPEGGAARTLRIEAQASWPALEGGAEAAFREANGDLNDVFFGMIPESEVRRFQN